MNYDERIKLIRTWMRSSILTRYTPPNGLDPKTLLTDIEETINSSLPSQLDERTFGLTLENILKEVIHNSTTRTLPVVKVFQKSAMKACEKLSRPHTEGFVVRDKPTYLNIIARRVRAGEAIPESYLRGQPKEDLLTNTDITEADLYKYMPHIDS